MQELAADPGMIYQESPTFLYGFSSMPPYFRITEKGKQVSWPTYMGLVTMNNICVVMNMPWPV